MPRDQEGVDLVADVDVVELLAGFAVHAREHVVQHVRLLRLAALGGALFLTVRNDLIDDVVEVVRIGGQALLPRTREDVFERETALAHRDLQRVDHRVDERVIVFAVERIEAIVEAAQPDGVERQRGHVVDDVDLVVGVEPLPLEHQLLGDVEHHRVIALHRAVAEVRQQDVVRLRPVRLRGVGGEQPVAGDRAHAAQRAAHGLVEARLVAQLVHEREPGDDGDRLAHHVEPEDRPELACERDQPLDRRDGADVEDVADQGFLRRARDRFEGFPGEHVARVPHAAKPYARSSSSSSAVSIFARRCTLGMTFAAAISPKSRPST